MGRVCIDTGTHESKDKASNFIQIHRKASRSKVACLEEIAKWVIFLKRSYCTDNLITKNECTFIKINQNKNLNIALTLM
jgi:dTDP-glucose pyrophosphorylase